MVHVRGIPHFLSEIPAFRAHVLGLEVDNNPRRKPLKLVRNGFPLGHRPFPTVIFRLRLEEIETEAKVFCGIHGYDLSQTLSSSKPLGIDALPGGLLQKEYEK